MKHLSHLTIRSLSAALALLVAAGCETTYQKRSVKGSGFLKDYSQLKDNDGAAMLSYAEPNTAFSSYSKILLEPVRAYASSKDSGMATLSKEKQQDLVNYFDAALRENLKKGGFTLVSVPGPGVIRLRVALTEAKGSLVLLDTVSSIVPLGIALSGATALVTGKHLSVGEAGAECEGLDAVTGKRLFAAVDARVGRKYTFRFDKLSKWHTAKDACDFWAEQLSARMAEKCRAPKAK